MFHLCTVLSYDNNICDERGTNLGKILSNFVKIPIEEISFRGVNISYGTIHFDYNHGFQ